MHIKEAIPSEKKRAMGAPPRSVEQSRDGGGGANAALPSSSTRRKRAEDDDVREDVVRNLVRDIRAEVVMRREDQHSGGANETKSDETKRARSMLEELAETHFCRGVFGGMFSSLPFIEHNLVDIVLIASKVPFRLVCSRQKPTSLRVSALEKDAVFG